MSKIKPRTPKSRQDEYNILDDKFLLDEEFDEIQTEENWRSFSFPVEEYY